MNFKAEYQVWDKEMFLREVRKRKVGNGKDKRLEPLIAQVEVGYGLRFCTVAYLQKHLGGRQCKLAMGCEELRLTKR